MAALPGLAALFGVVGVAYVQQNEFNNLRNQINDALNRIGQTEQEQSSICTSVLYSRRYIKIYVFISNIIG